MTAVWPTGSLGEINWSKWTTIIIIGIIVIFIIIIRILPQCSLSTGLFVSRLRRSWRPTERSIKLILALEKRTRRSRVEFSNRFLHYYPYSTPLSTPHWNFSFVISGIISFRHHCWITNSCPFMSLILYSRDSRGDIDFIEIPWNVCRGNSIKRKRQREGWLGTG